MEKIEVGQRWEMRCGQIITVDNIVDGDPHSIKCGEKLSWQPNGRYWDDVINSRYDLIRRIH